MVGGARGFGYDFFLFGIGQLPLVSYALIELGPVFAGPDYFNPASNYRP